MFHIDATFENQRVIAISLDGHTYDTIIKDNFSGDFRHATLTPLQLSYIMQFNFDVDGKPKGFEEMYKELEPIFVGWPNNVRPIP